MEDEDNGILASVPSQYIAQAARALPEPATALQEGVSVVIDLTAASDQHPLVAGTAKSPSVQSAVIGWTAY